MRSAAPAAAASAAIPSRPPAGPRFVMRLAAQWAGADRGVDAGAVSGAGRGVDAGAGSGAGRGVDAGAVSACGSWCGWLSRWWRRCFAVGWVQTVVLVGPDGQWGERVRAGTW